MEYINDININEAVIHVLDNNSDEPLLNEYSLDLTEDRYKFIFKHIEKCLKDENLKYAVFNDEKSIVKEVCKDYLNGIDYDLINLSKKIAKQLFAIMNGNTNIPSCDLIVASIVTDKGPMIAILKLDYVKNFTHNIEFINEKLGIDIVPLSSGLPGSGQKINKAAFIKPIRDEYFNLMILDKQIRKNLDDEYISNYFINNFLGCNIVENERDMTKSFVNATEEWIRANFYEEPYKSMKVRNAIKERLREDETIDINNFADEVLSPDEAQNYKMFMTQAVPEKITVDTAWANKKLKRTRLKIDNSIDIYVDDEEYKDSSKFELVRNGDGTVNLVIKYITNIIEK